MALHHSSALFKCGGKRDSDSYHTLPSSFALCAGKQPSPACGRERANLSSCLTFRRNHFAWYWRETRLPKRVRGWSWRMPSASAKEEAFISSHTGKLQDVAHIKDYLTDLQEYPNPLLDNKFFHPVTGFFASENDVVAQEVQVDMRNQTDGVYFRLGGPRETVYFRADDVRAAIVTCGGLCPGLNTVIRELVFGLWNQYGVRDILGIKGGYRGFYASNTEQLTPKGVSDWHKKGGTMLGTTRGGHDTVKIVDSIQDRGINQVYIIGGDGTQRGALKIHEEVVRRGLRISVVGIPKTVDNDVAVIDKSFGFDTAVEAAQAAINAAHVEAESTPNGVGLVKVMGRYAGHIAMAATLASRDVDCCLIPEVPFFVDGEGGLFQFMEHKLRDNGHCVILVAEGAGQDLVAQSAGTGILKDASGNRLLLDTGLWLSTTLKDRWAKKKKESLSLKYIDPTYMVRAVPSNASDTIYCTMLAHTAIHGAMAGFTGFITGPVNNRYCYIPMELVTNAQAVVNVEDRTWAWVRSANNQPDFVPQAERTPPLDVKQHASTCLTGRHAACGARATRNAFTTHSMMLLKNVDCILTDRARWLPSSPRHSW